MQAIEGKGVLRRVEYDSHTIDRVAVQAISRIFHVWKVSQSQAAELTTLSVRTLQRINSGEWTGSLTDDQRQRASALVGIYKGLHLYFNDQLADEWPRLKNTGPIFGGQTPLDVLAEGGLLSMIEVRDYIDALRGGM